MNPQKRKARGQQRLAKDHFGQGVKKRKPSLAGKGEKREKNKEGLKFKNKTKQKNPPSICYPLGQFSTYRLDKISPPHPNPTLGPISLPLGRIRPSERIIKV